MDDNAEEFFLVWLAEQFGIRAHCVETYDEVATDYVVFIIVEGDDVGIVIVSEILIIDLKDFLIIYEEIAYFSHFSSVRGSYLLDPCRCIALAYLRHFHIFC